MGEKFSRCDFNRGTIVGARRAGLIFSTAELKKQKKNLKKNYTNSITF